jgi:hypothetical protein
MATRLYLRFTQAAEVSPSFSASWTNTTSSARHHLARDADATDTTGAGTNRSWTAGEVRLDRQYVSEKMRAGIVFDSATVTMVTRCNSSAADDNVFARFGVRILSADGATVRATLLAVGAHGSQTEYVVTPTAHIVIVAQDEALSSYTTQAGDRIVVEVGFTDSAGTSPTARNYYGSSVASDWPETEGQPAAAGNPWVEFSNNIQWLDGSGVANVAERGPDTLFFGYSATAGSDLEVDLSGNNDDWIHDNTWIYRQNHSAVALQSAFTIDFACLIDNTDSGYLFENNLDAAPNNAIVVDGAGDLDFYVGSTMEASIDIPGVAASARLLIGTWSAEANPLTTGSTDVLRHDVRLYNADTGAWDGASFTTGVLTGFDGSADTVFGARQTDGTDAFTGTLRMVRLSSHWHPPKELERCFLDVSAAPTPVGVTRLAWPTMRHTDAAWGDDGYFAGPPHIWAAKSVHRNDLRLWGPLINEIYAGTTTSDESWTVDDPGSGTYLMHLSTLRRRPLPPGCTRVRCRFWMENNAASGRVIVRSYVSDRPGFLVQPSPSPVANIYEAVASSSINNGTSGWFTIDHTIAPTDADGYLYHWLAVNDTAPEASYIVRAVSLDPVPYGLSAA